MSEQRLKIYVASSWRNQRQPEVVQVLRSRGHHVYDFRYPAPGVHGFHWEEIDLDWKSWSAAQYRDALEHSIAQGGFTDDFGAMEWADVCVLVLPCGRSAHLEAGWFVGAQRPLFILLDHGEVTPELMYLMATKVCLSLDEVLEALDGAEVTDGE